MKVLVIRNDKIGDFMLAWPALALLKAQYPQIRVTVLVPAYTREMAELCPWVDNIILDRHDTGPANLSCLYLASRFRKARFNASISLFSEMRTSFAVWLARIPKRHGPATKLAQIFLNRRLRQRRSQSDRPEYEYNCDLVRDYIERRGDSPPPLPAPPYLSFDTSEITRIREDYYRSNKINDECKLVIIHPGSGGSAINLSLHQYGRLARMLAQNPELHFVFTAGPGEDERAEELSAMAGKLDHSIYHSTQGLAAFSRFIATCDLFISGSTGPLHIAGALNVKTAAFYPARRSATPLRWQTVNAAARRVSFSPAQYRGNNDMKTIDIAASADRILELLASHT